MSANEVIAPCNLCHFVEVIRPYGDQDAMVCDDCRRELNESSAAVTELAEKAGAILRRLG